MSTVLRIMLAVASAGTLARAGDDWPEFRGPLGRGVAAGPIRREWTEHEGIAWTTALPGRGAASPIVVGDLVVVTASSGHRQDRLHVIACDVETGNVRWHRVFWATGRTLCHPTTAVAANTPASDGRRIVALFSSCDLFALDLEGRLLWQRNLAVEHPRSGNDVGMGTSPRIVDGTVIVQIDCQGDAFAAGIDATTGNDRWIVPRERIASWSTPLSLPTADGAAAVILQNERGLEQRRVADGSLAWSWKGSCAAIAAASEADGVLYVPGDGISAVSRDASAPAWRSGRLSSGIASPVTWKGLVACINRAGVLVVGATADGSLRGQCRLAGSFWASPVVAGDVVVALNREGRAFVVDVAAEPKVIAENVLPGTFTATPAVSSRCLYLRSETALWKVAAP